MIKHCFPLPLNPLPLFRAREVYARIRYPFFRSQYLISGPVLELVVGTTVGKFNRLKSYITDLSTHQRPLVPQGHYRLKARQPSHNLYSDTLARGSNHQYIEFLFSIFTAGPTTYAKGY